MRNYPARSPRGGCTVSLPEDHHDRWLGDPDATIPTVSAHATRLDQLDAAPRTVTVWRSSATFSWINSCAPVSDLVRLACHSTSAHEDAVCADFARTISDRRTLLSLLKRRGADRVTAARAYARACDADRLLSDAVLNALMARRTLIGLMRRSRSEAETIARDAISRSIAAARQDYQTEARRNLFWAGIERPESFDQGGPFGATASTAAATMIDRLRAEGWGTETRRLPAYLGEQLARCLSLGSIDDGLAMDWVKHVVRGWQPPPDEHWLLAAAMRVRASVLFDAAGYASRAGIVCDDISAALHYVLIGDAVGIAPSEAFDPAYYAERHPDVMDAGAHRLLHYLNGGRGEGRRPIAQVPYRIDKAKLDLARDNVIIVVHETSRTGAPVLGWNVARQLAARHNVFTILLGGGPLTGAYAALSTAVLGPLDMHVLDPIEFGYGLRRMLDLHEFKFAIINSCVSGSLIEHCFIRLIPTVLLMHEFGSYVYARNSLRAILDMATEIVFPAQLVADSTLEVHPPLRKRRLRILPQGMSVLPGMADAPTPPLPALRRLAEARRAGAFIVLGAGSVEYRKGVDLFLSVAMGVCRGPSARPIHFVWVGRNYRPDEDMAYSIYLREQQQRTGLCDHVTFIDEIPDLERAYALADAFLLTSRLDPMPNVSIDAAHRGIPIVCFEGASGTADILLTDPVTAAGVVAHLDTMAAAQAILALVNDAGLRQRVSAAIRSLARSVFDMEAYCDTLDTLGSEASMRFSKLRDDADRLCITEGFDRQRRSGSRPPFETARQAARCMVARGILGAESLTNRCP